MRSCTGEARTMWWCAAAALAACVSFVSAPEVAHGAPKGYALKTLNLGPGVYTSIFGINNRGTLVGNAADPEDVVWAHVYGFVGDGETFERVVVAPSEVWDFTEVNQINDHGVAVGEFASADSPSLRGFVRHADGDIEILPLPEGATGMEAMDINNAGVIAGIYFGEGRPHGFTYSDGVFTTRDVEGALWTHVTGIDDRGRLAGRFLTQTDGRFVQHGFVMDGDTLHVLDVPGAAGTYARDVNNAGDVAGVWFDANFNGHGFVWSKGRFQTLDFADSAFGDVWLLSINDRGVVVGTYDYFSWGLVGQRSNGR